MNIIIIKTQSLNNKVNNIHSSSRKALGAGANVLDRKIGAPCSSPVKVATQQTFSILMPIMKPPVGAQDVIIKTLTHRAFVRLFSCFSVDLQYFSCARRGRGIFHPP